MTKNKQDKLRVALIGAGGIAGAHMRYYQDMDDVEMVAAADVVLERAQKSCEEYEIPAAYADYEEMLRQVEPDAVSVCTPNGLHAPCSIAALDAGAHVLVEKPLAMNAREGQQMLDAAEKNNKKLIIGFQNRYDPRTQFIKKLVDDGELGTVLYARVQSLRRRGIPNWGVFGRKDLQGGGPLIDIGVHMLETAHYAMGAPQPVAASGSTYTYIGDKPSNVASVWPNWDYKTYTVEDLAVGHIRFANGAMLSIETSFAAHIEKGEGNFTLMGEKGGTYLGSAGFFPRRQRLHGQHPARLAAQRPGSRRLRPEDAQLRRSRPLRRGNPVARRARADGAEDDGRAVRIGRTGAGSTDRVGVNPTPPQPPTRVRTPQTFPSRLKPSALLRGRIPRSCGAQ